MGQNPAKLKLIVFMKYNNRKSIFVENSQYMYLKNRKNTLKFAIRKNKPKKWERIRQIIKEMLYILN